MVGASPPPKTRFTNHDRLSGCLVLYSLTTGGAAASPPLCCGAAAVSLPPLSLSLSLSLSLISGRHTGRLALPTPRTRHSFCPLSLSLPLPAVNPPRRVAHGQPGSPRFLFAVSGNRVRAAATASGRATENPSTNQYYPSPRGALARVCPVAFRRACCTVLEAVGARGGRAASEPPRASGSRRGPGEAAGKVPVRGGRAYDGRTDGFWREGRDARRRFRRVPVPAPPLLLCSCVRGRTRRGSVAPAVEGALQTREGSPCGGWPVGLGARWGPLGPRVSGWLG